MCSANVRSSCEYRELEKNNHELLNRIENLKQALKKVNKEKKKMSETHMRKSSHFLPRR